MLDTLLRLLGIQGRRDGGHSRRRDGGRRPDGGEGRVGYEPRPHLPVLLPLVDGQDHEDVEDEERNDNEEEGDARESHLHRNHHDLEIGLCPRQNITSKANWELPPSLRN